MLLERDHVVQVELFLISTPSTCNDNHDERNASRLDRKISHIQSVELIWTDPDITALWFLLFASASLINMDMVDSASFIKREHRKIRCGNGIWPGEILRENELDLI